MDFKSKKAIYLQIADYICEQILLMRWKETEKIPSVRELAVSLAVNPNTVMRTYAFLEDKNIIETQRGIGYFAAENAREQVLKFKKQAFLKEDLPEIFKAMDLLGINFADFKQLYVERTKYENE